MVLGCGSYDNRGVNGIKSENMLLTYQSNDSQGTVSSYVTDDYFGILGDKSGASLPSDALTIAVGRIPAVDTYEAEAAINKIVKCAKEIGKLMIGLAERGIDFTLTKVFDGFKKISPALVALAIVSGSILFLPVTLLDKLGLNNLPEAIKTITGTLFLLSCALILTILCSVVFQRVIKATKHKKLLKDLRKSFIELSIRHKKIIVKLMKSSSKSIELDSLSGDTIYLSEHNFIHRPQQVVDAFVLYDNKYTYVPQPWLIDLYEKDPELFELDDRKDAK